MSKSDQNAVKSQANNQIATNNANEANANQTAQGVLSTAQGTAADLLPSITGGYQDIASTGGYDPTIAGTINTTFGNLATTGGVSDADANAMQNQAAEAAKSTYQTGQDSAARASAATGGYVVQMSTNLAAPVWIPVLTNGTGSSGAISFLTNTTSSPNQFYQLKFP